MNGWWQRMQEEAQKRWHDNMAKAAWIKERQRHDAEAKRQPQPATEDPFTQVEQQAAELRRQCASGMISEAECRRHLRELMITDSLGNWWMVGTNSGEWYSYQDENWVRTEPPRPAPKGTMTPSPPVIGTRHKEVFEPAPKQGKVILLTIGAIAIFLMFLVLFTYQRERHKDQAFSETLQKLDDADPDVVAGAARSLVNLYRYRRFFGLGASPYRQQCIFILQNALKMQGKEVRGRQAFLGALKEMDPNVMQGARLKGVDLSGLDLSGINFKEATLEKANLSGASLEKTNLSGARLRGGTDLHMAKLIGTDLTNAVFQDPEDKAKSANLEKATINGAVLIGANLSHTRLVGTIFQNITQWDRKTDFEDANCQKAQFDTSSEFYKWGQKNFPKCFKPITPPPLPPINISGIWHGEHGVVYRFDQKMSTFEVTAENPKSGMKGRGNGTITENRIEFTYERNWPSDIISKGKAIGSVSADANQITLQVDDSRFGKGQVVIVR